LTTDSATLPETETRPTTLRAIICVIIAVTFFGLAYGYSLPVLSLIMEREGLSSTLIGLNTATSSAAVLVFGPFVPRLLVRFGLRIPIFVSIIVSTALIVPIAFTEPLYAWFPLRFVLGGAIFIALIATDIWVTQGASAKTRGRLVAIYGAAVAGGVAAGPLLVSFTGADGYAPFWTAGGLLAFSTIPMLLAFGPSPHMSRSARPPLLRFISVVPVATVAVIIFGVMDASILALLPIYGVREGMTDEASVKLVSIVLGGSVVLQLPIGYLADRFPKQAVLFGLGLVGAAAAAIYPAVFHTIPALFICLFVLGGCVTGLYVVSLAILGDRFSGGALAAAVTLFTMMLSAGTTTGPVLSGIAMQAYDPHGLPATISGAMLMVPIVGLVTWMVWLGRGRKL